MSATTLTDSLLPPTWGTPGTPGTRGPDDRPISVWTRLAIICSMSVAMAFLSGSSFSSMSGFLTSMMWMMSSNRLMLKSKSVAISRPADSMDSTFCGYDGMLIRAACTSRGLTNCSWKMRVTNRSSGVTTSLFCTGTLPFPATEWHTEHF